MEKTNNYREVKCSDRLPIICDEWYYTDAGKLFFDFGTWYTTDALDKDSTYEFDPSYWLEPFDPQAEAQERYEKAKKYLQRVYNRTALSIVELVSIKIAAGYENK